MKILLLSGSDSKGGAARVALYLGQGMRERGHDVTMLVTRKSTDEPWIQQLAAGPPDLRSVSGRVIHRLGLNALNLNSIQPYDLPLAYLRQFDIIHLHDLPAHFNLTGLAWLARARAVAWTLHTLNAFTGACFYPYGCDRWRHHCGSCPQFGNWPLNWLHRDASMMQHFIKRSIYRSVTWQPICVSHWLTQQARRSPLLGQLNPVPILNAVDTASFYPVDKAEAKQRLGLPLDKPSLMFALSANVEDRRKGMDIILNALPKLKTRDVVLMPTAINTPGSAFQSMFEQFTTLPPRHLADVPSLRDYYSAADLIWHPTLADTSSMVSLEALACGTPVLAAAVGGVPEIVRDGISGALIPPNDSDALAFITDKLLDDRIHLRNLGHSGRRWVESEFSLPRFLNEHELLYEQMLR